VPEAASKGNAADKAAKATGKKKHGAASRRARTDGATKLHLEHHF
jgi:hypothetical protein